jgi:hypothetical protein
MRDGRRRVLGGKGGRNSDEKYEGSFHYCAAGSVEWRPTSTTTNVQRFGFKNVEKSASYIVAMKSRLRGMSATFME